MKDKGDKMGKEKSGTSDKNKDVDGKNWDALKKEFDEYKKQSEQELEKYKKYKQQHEIDKEFTYEINNIMSNISKGELTTTFEGDYTGDMKDIQDNVNNTIKTLNSINEEIINLYASICEGKLDTRGRVDQFEGSWGGLISGVNELVASLVKPLKENSEIIERISKGDIPEKITEEYKGEFDDIKENVNRCVDVLGGLMVDTIDSLEGLSNNDLTKIITTNYPGAFQRIPDSLNNTLYSLTQTLQEVNKNSGIVASAAEEMSASAEEVNASSEEVSSSIQQISNGANSTSTQINKVIEEIKKAQEASLSGEAVSTEVANQMETIKITTEEGANKVQSLGEKSKMIDNIADTINQISEQTNLLALNAAIEAARAGDAGRGFAVVADEVRKLAEESKEATQQIRELINSIQEEIQAAVKSMDENKNQVEAGASGVEESKKAFSTLPPIVEAINTSATEVAGVAQENAASSEETSSAMQEITASMQQVTNSSQELSSVADRLVNIIGQFKFDIGSDSVSGTVENSKEIPPDDKTPVSKGEVSKETPVVEEK